ncbi:MAG: response regulator [Armatimonadetes bacterium]|nr:response regulator [Armatimonadota bacterium]MBS1726488.1 response regulator [Armatimonadota bacterium]
MDTSAQYHPKILVVDDDATNIHFLKRLLDIGGYDDIRTASSGREALLEGASYDPDLILLDLQMPEMDGYEVLRVMRPLRNSGVYLPILVFTADATHSARKKALELGASDFLTKPGDATEILLRVKNFLTMRFWSKELNERNIDLEERVRARTRELEESHRDVIHRLARAGEYRDDDTGHHTRRVGELSARIATALRLPTDTVKLIQLAALLHDLGKIGIPDSILLKPGRLTEEEFRQMQQHCMAGASILAQGNTPLLQMAEKIAAHHHERYDGSGYPSGLRGEEIPIEARIVSVADVFDALTHERPYKKAWDRESAKAEILSQKGRQFDPQVVDAFLAVRSFDLF